MKKEDAVIRDAVKALTKSPELSCRDFIEERLSDEDGINFITLLCYKLQEQRRKVVDKMEKKIGTDLNDGFWETYYQIEEKVTVDFSTVFCEEGDHFEAIKNLMKDVGIKKTKDHQHLHFSDEDENEEAYKSYGIK